MQFSNNQENAQSKYIQITSFDLWELYPKFHI